MPKKIIMIYDLKSKDSVRIRFNRKLFEYTTQSHQGEYKVVSKGVLREYEKPVRSVIIFSNEHVIKVRKVLKEFKVDHRLFEIAKELK
jgi:hypothetical protein